MTENSCPYIEFQFFNSSGTKLNVPNNLITNASWSRSLNSLGTAVITIPSDCTDIDFDVISQEDLGLLIGMAESSGQALLPDLETFYFLRRFKETVTDKRGQYRLTFKDANHLLDRRIVAYRANDPEGSSPQAYVSEAGNVALRRIFDTNYGALVSDTDRNLTPYVSSSGIATPSLFVDKEIQWKSILRTMQQICRTSRDKGQDLFFDLVALPTATDIRFEFRTYINQRGVDKTSTVVHTNNPFFKLLSFEIDYDIPNVGYSAGIGRGRERQVSIATSSRATSGRFTRLEDFKSVRSGIQDVIDDEANNIVNDTAGIYRVEGQLLGNLSQSFGFGDRFTVHHRGLEIICEVTSISSTYSQQEYTRVVTIKSVGD